MSPVTGALPLWLLVSGALWLSASPIPAQAAAVHQPTETSSWSSDRNDAPAMAEHLSKRRGSRRQQERMESPDDTHPVVMFVVLVGATVLGIWEIRWLFRLVTRRFRGTTTRGCPGCGSSMPYGADFCPRCSTISLPNGRRIN